MKVLCLGVCNLYADFTGIVGMKHMSVYYMYQNYAGGILFEYHIYEYLILKHSMTSSRILGYLSRTGRGRAGQRSMKIEQDEGRL